MLPCLVKERAAYSGESGTRHPNLRKAEVGYFAHRELPKPGPFKIPLLTVRPGV